MNCNVWNINFGAKLKSLQGLHIACNSSMSNNINPSYKQKDKQTNFSTGTVIRNSRNKILHLHLQIKGKRTKDETDVFSITLLFFSLSLYV